MVSGLGSKIYLVQRDGHLPPVLLFLGRGLRETDFGDWSPRPGCMVRFLRFGLRGSTTETRETGERDEGDKRETRDERTETAPAQG